MKKRAATKRESQTRQAGIFEDRQKKSMLSLCLMALLFQSGCSAVASYEVLKENQTDLSVLSTEAREMPSETVNEVGADPALAKFGRLEALSRRLDAMVTSRSPTAQELALAEAMYRAKKYDRYPRLTPGADLPINSSKVPAVTLSADQVIWDGGKTSIEEHLMRLKVEKIKRELWQERNDKVFLGLQAFVNIARFTERLKETEKLRAQIKELASIVEDRLAGGVSDRGESIRLKSALREVDRQAIIDSSLLMEAQNELKDLLEASFEIENLSSLRSQCERTSLEIPSPAVAIALINLETARKETEITQSRRFPKVILGGVASIGSNALGGPVFGLRLDASEMLGLDRKSTFEAAKSALAAATATYELTKKAERAQSAKIESEFASLIQQKSALANIRSEAVATIELYKEQVEAGMMSIVEGEVLYKELSSLTQSLIDINAKITVNCLSAAKQAGQIVPLGGSIVAQ